MAEIQLPLVISIAALLLSCLTAYVTLFRRGTVRMTRPTTIYFGADGRSNGVLTEAAAPRIPKVYLRTLLYSTAKRGRIIESMFVTIRRGETQQTFPVWVYGEDGLKRGSGLYVGDTGVIFNHHFLMPRDGSDFVFLAGEYHVEVFAILVGSKKKLHLCAISLNLSATMAVALKAPKGGVFFDWGSDLGRYEAHAIQELHC